MLAPARTQTGHELGRRCCPISLEDEVPEMWARPKGPAQMEEHGFQASFPWRRDEPLGHWYLSQNGLIPGGEACCLVSLSCGIHTYSVNT